MLQHLCGLEGLLWAALLDVGISALFSPLLYAQVGWDIPNSNESLLWYVHRVNDYKFNTSFSLSAKLLKEDKSGTGLIRLPCCANSSEARPVTKINLRFW